MTPDERRNPTKMIDQSRRRRIAAGAGVEPHEVNELVKQFDGMADMMKRMSGMGIRDRMRTDAGAGARAACSIPAAMLAKQKVGTGKRLTPQEKAKLKKAARTRSGGRNATRRTRDSDGQPVSAQPRRQSTTDLDN